MNFSKHLLNALVVTLVAGMLTFAVGQRPQGAGGPPAGGPPIEHLGRVLDLTEAQQAQIKAIREQAAEATKPYHEQLTPLMEQVKTLAEAATFNEAAFRALNAEMAPIQLEIHVIQAKAHWAIQNVLTPAQKTKLAEFHKMMGARGGSGRPGGPGGGRPAGGERPGGSRGPGSAQ